MEAYKVGVKLVMTTNHAQVVQLLLKDLAGINVATDKLIGKFGALKVAIAGAATAFTGEKMLSGMVALIRKTEDLSHAFVQIQKLGDHDVSDMSMVRQRAIDVIRSVRGITEKEVLDIYGQTYSLVGKENAMGLMPLLSKFSVLMGNTTGSFSTNPQNARDLLRAAEQMGRLTDERTKNVDIDKFKHFLDIVAKFATVTHGMVNAQTLRQMATTGGPGFYGMNDQSLMVSAILSQYMGGPRYGTATMSLMQQMAGGTMFKRNAEALQEIGILNQGEWGTSGGRVIVQQQARDRLAKIFNQPLEAVLGTLLPAMTSHGITDPVKQVQELFALFTRQTTQREMADMLMNWGQMQREVERMQQAKGLNESLDLANSGDVSQNMDNLAKAWQNFLYSFSDANTDMFVGVLGKMTDGIQAATAWAYEHQVQVQRAVEVFTVVGVGLMALGSAALIAALAPLIGPAGIIAGVVLALGALVTFHWETVKDAFQSFADWLMNWTNKIRNFFGLATINSAGATVTPQPGGALIGQALGGVTKEQLDATKNNTKEMERLQQSIDSLRGLMNYIPGISGGANGGLVNAAYFGDQVNSDSIMMPNSGPGSVVTGAPFTSGGGYSVQGIAVKGKDGKTRIVPHASAALSGVALPSGSLSGVPTTGVFDRRWVSAEQARTPGLLERWIATAANEDYPSTPEGKRAFQAVLEETANRASLRGTSLRKEARWTSEGGYYEGHPHWQILGDKKNLPAALAIAKSVLAGSDISKGATDNSSGGLAVRERKSGKFIWHGAIHGESFFHPGWAEPALAKKYHRWHDDQIARGAAARQGAAYDEYVPHSDGGVSHAIPPMSCHNMVETPVVLQLDGHVVAKNTMKHMVRHGNRAGHGGRMPDYSATRPLGI